MNPKTSMRKKVQILVIFTILVWATQTMLHQWGYGAEAPAARPDAPATTAPAPDAPASAGGERFVPGRARFAAGATLALRAEATVYGAEVKLRQVCRWSNADAATFAPVAELVLARVSAATPFQSISVDQIRQTLHDAGVNLAVVRFAGPMSCTVARSDVKFDEQAALQQWIDARQGRATTSGPQTRPAGSPAASDAVPAAAALAPVAAVEEPAHARRLSDLLLEDLAVRASLPVEQLQVNFNPADQRVLALAEPQFKFNVEPRHVYGLGDVSWDILVVTEGGQKKVTISATARAWQTQLVLTRPVAYHQVIRPEDLIEKHLLVDRCGDDPLLNLGQAAGQQAARELKPGTVLTAKLVEPMPLARVGQFITVTLLQGSVRVKTVARAMEGGTFGQTIKVKNEATGDVYQVTLTGPQEATMGPPPAIARVSLND